MTYEKIAVKAARDFLVPIFSYVTLHVYVILVRATYEKIGTKAARDFGFVPIFSYVVSSMCTIFRDSSDYPANRGFHAPRQPRIDRLSD